MEATATKQPIQPRPEPSEAQLRTLDAIKELRDQSGDARWPTTPEVANYLGRAISTVHEHICGLRACGLLEIGNGKRGNIRPTSSGETLLRRRKKLAMHFAR